MKLFFMIVSFVCIQSCLQASRHLMPYTSNASRHGKMTNIRYPEHHHPHRNRWAERLHHDHAAAQQRPDPDVDNMHMRQQERRNRAQQDQIASCAIFAMLSTIFAELLIVVKFAS